MAFIAFGVNHMPIGIDEVPVRCPSCEMENPADIMVVGKYLHVFWIPVFPVDKELNIICRSCGLKRYGLPFNSNLLKNYQQLKRDFRHPWISYIGISCLVLLVLTIITVRVIRGY